MGIRLFSSAASANEGSNKPLSKDFKLFLNADIDKLDILEYIKNKSGIYMWTNKLNGKKYVGSSVNLRRRMLQYYNVNRLLNEKSMPINISLLKHGYQNFSLTILEFCDINSLMFKEKHYFEVYSPEYNILKTPGSPDRGKGWKHSEAVINKIRIAAINRMKSPEVLAEMSVNQSSGIKVEVTDIETQTVTIYHAIKAAARALSIDKRYIEAYIYLNQDQPVLNKYTFKLIKNDKNNHFNDPYIKLQKTSQSLEVTNVETKEVTIYPSIGSAAKALGYRQGSISLYLKDNRIKPFKGLYLFKLIK
uniref:GIY-YIG endonuclease n=1 Tax=Cordyceps cicadae TaxID=218633 RepID=A0A481S1K2_9HYPO|nr:GIY-YIG endonuclease [Cordyceps cicadae]QBG64891.1 GIY-YIG endonuclease [Cordyceps cicadae]